MADAQVIGAGRPTCVDEAGAEDEIDALVGNGPITEQVNSQANVSTPGEASVNYRPDIDGLRAFAVIAVIVFHMDSSWCPGGFVGVDVFFVISGYVVTLSMAHHHDWTCNPCGFLYKFYARRLKRLSPSLIVMVVLTGFGMALIIPWFIAELPHYFGMGIFGLVGFGNRYITHHPLGFDYWAPDWNSARLTAMNPFLHLWSLGVEEQFYLFAPLSFWMAYSVNRCHVGQTRNAFGVEIRPHSCFALLAFIALLFWSMAESAEMTHKHPQKAYFSTVSRFWELTVGVILAHAQHSIQSFSPEFATPAMGCKVSVLAACLDVCAVMLLVYAIISTTKVDFPFPTALLAVVGSACFIVAGTLQNKFSVTLPWILRFRSISCWPISVYVGKISYVLYLWHWPVFVLLKWTSGFDTVISRISGLLLTIALACGSYHCLEMRIARWRPHALRVLACMLTLLALAVLLMVALWGPLHGALCGSLLCGSFPHQRTDSYNHTMGCACRLVDSTFHVPIYATISLGASSASHPPCFMEQWHPPVGVVPAYLSVKGPVIHLMGDSHGAYLQPSLQAAVAGHFHVNSLYVHGFAVMGCITTRDGALAWLEPGEANYQCSQPLRERLEVLINTLKKGDGVAVVQHMGRFCQDQPSCPRLNVTAYSLMTKCLSALHVLARSRGAFLLLFGTQPLIPVDAKWCVATAWHPRNVAAGGVDCNLDVEQSRKAKSLLDAFLTTLASSHDDVYFVDLHDRLCDTKTCNGFIPGTSTIAYEDTNHLSPGGIVYLSPFICQSLAHQGLMKAD